MPSVVVATLSVNFSAETTGSEGAIKMEVDDRAQGLNGGDTSFEPGDSVGFWLFKDGNVTIEAGPTSTAGGITAAGSASKDIDEFIAFSNSDSGSLGYPTSGGVTLTWQGRVYKIVEENGHATVTTWSGTLDRTYSQLKTSDGSKIAGVLRAVYTASGSLYRLQSVPTDITEVSIFAIGSIA